MELLSSRKVSTMTKILCHKDGLSSITVVALLREYRERLDWSPLIKFNYVNVVLFPFFLVLIGGARERPEIKRKEVSLEEAAHH